MPMCPIHNAEMRAGQRGGFYCSKKMPDGSYCTQRASGQAPPPQYPPTPTNYPPAPVPAFSTQPTTNKHLMAIAALDFAGKVYQGTADPQGALDLANMAFERWSGDLS